MKKIKVLKKALFALGLTTAPAAVPVETTAAPNVQKITVVPNQKTTNKTEDSLSFNDVFLFDQQVSNRVLLSSMAENLDSMQLQILSNQNDSLSSHELEEVNRLKLSHSLTNKINSFIQTRTFVTDTLELDSAWNRLCGLETKMLQFIAHFEDIRARAYFDKKSKKYTYAMGLTVDENGRPVTANSRIKSVEQLYKIWGQYVRHGAEERPHEKSQMDNCLFGIMCQTLPISKMTDEQIISSGSFAFNGGPKFLISFKHKQKSRFATLMYRYVHTMDSLDLDSLLKLHAEFCTSRGKEVLALQKRRAVEERAIAGDIYFVLSKEEKDSLPPALQKKALVLNELTVGASYNLDIPTIEDPEAYINKVSKIQGDTVTTKIQKQFYVPTKKPQPKRSISTTKQPNTIRVRRNIRGQ